MYIASKMLHYLFSKYSLWNIADRIHDSVIQDTLYCTAEYIFMIIISGLTGCSVHPPQHNFIIRCPSRTLPELHSKIHFWFKPWLLRACVVNDLRIFSGFVVHFVQPSRCQCDDLIDSYTGKIDHDVPAHIDIFDSAFTQFI